MVYGNHSAGGLYHRSVRTGERRTRVGSVLLIGIDDGRGERWGGPEAVTNPPDVTKSHLKVLSLYCTWN